MLKKIGIVIIAALLAGTASLVAQNWPNLPIVGGASYCASSVNNVCVSTIPAGPALTGSETIPADTNIAGSGQPQTVKIGVATLGSGALTYNAPLTGASITLTSLTRQLILEPAGTIAALTVVLPAATTLVDSQRINICGTQIVTALTVTAGSGTTVSGAPTAMLVPVVTGGASCFGWIYRQANTTWYRTQ